MVSDLLVGVMLLVMGGGSWQLFGVVSWSCVLALDASRFYACGPECGLSLKVMLFRQAAKSALGLRQSSRRASGSPPRASLSWGSARVVGICICILSFS